MKNMIVVFVSLFVFGCAVETSQQSPNEFKANKCVTAGASYKISFNEISGNCGSLTTQVINIPKDGVMKLDLSCTEGPGSREDGCTVYIDQKCNQVEKGKTVNITEVGKMVWSADGSHGEGVETMTLKADNYFCNSTYQVKAVRL